MIDNIFPAILIIFNQFMPLSKEKDVTQTTSFYMLGIISPKKVKRELKFSPSSI